MYITQEKIDRINALARKAKTPEGLTAEESAELAARRTVELLTGSLKSCLTPEDLKSCADKIRAHTRT